MKVFYMVLGLAIGIMWIVFLYKACSPSVNFTGDNQQLQKVVRVYAPRATAGSATSTIKQKSLISPTSCLIFAVFCALDLGIWFWGRHAIKSICEREDKSPAEKLQAIANEDILFDLPLYAGLLGTVFGFFLIAQGSSSSRDVAYISTIMGIIVSASMRLFILRPIRHRLQNAI